MAEPDEPHVHTPVEEFLEHARLRARESEAGIGAAVVRSDFEDGKRFWECVVSDGSEWHYIRVDENPDLGPFPGVDPEDIELGIERFALGLPSEYRLRALLNANPLHLARGGTVVD